MVSKGHSVRSTAATGPPVARAARGTATAKAATAATGTESTSSPTGDTASGTTPRSAGPPPPQKPAGGHTQHGPGNHPGQRQQQPLPHQHPAGLRAAEADPRMTAASVTAGPEVQHQSLGQRDHGGEPQGDGERQRQAVDGLQVHRLGGRLGPVDLGVGHTLLGGVLGPPGDPVGSHGGHARGEVGSGPTEEGPAAGATRWRPAGVKPAPSDRLATNTARPTTV